MTLGAVALLLILILWARLHAFLALLISSMALGLACGMEPLQVIKSIQFGFGDALGFIAVVVALGAMIGRFLEHSGGGRVLAEWLLAKFGRENAQWAVFAAAFLVGLPIFFEVGFIILVPLAWNLARESKKSLLFYGLPMTAALTVTHAMIPPHPAPSAAAALLGADLGLTILYSALLAIPMAIAGGIVYGRWIAARIFVPVPQIATRHQRAEDAGAPPTVSLVILLLLLPVLFIFAASLADLWQLPLRTQLGFLGHPFTALLITALLSMYLFGMRPGPQPRPDRPDGHGVPHAHRHFVSHHGRGRRLQAGADRFGRRPVRGRVARLLGPLAPLGGLFGGGRFAHGARLGDGSHHHGGRHRGAADEGARWLLAGDDRAGAVRGGHHFVPRQ